MRTAITRGRGSADDTDRDHARSPGSPGRPPQAPDAPPRPRRPAASAGPPGSWSPRTTLHSWGSSSRVGRAQQATDAGHPGSPASLNSGPVGSFLVRSSAWLASARAAMVRNCISRTGGVSSGPTLPEQHRPGESTVVAMAVRPGPGDGTSSAWTSASWRQPSPTCRVCSVRALRRRSRSDGCEIVLDRVRRRSLDAQTCPTGYRRLGRGPGSRVH